MFLFNCMRELVLNLYFMVVFPLSIIVLKDCLNKETRHALFLNLGKCAVPLPFFFSVPLHKLSQTGGLLCFTVAFQLEQQQRV